MVQHLLIMPEVPGSILRTRKINEQTKMPKISIAKLLIFTYIFWIFRKLNFVFVNHTIILTSYV
jgi:hypothetical protein